MNIPRVVIGAASSGSGKTMFTSAFLYHLEQMGKKAIGFKCGPDYIDPMFHKKVTGVECRNLDPFFLDKEGMVQVLSKCKEFDVAVLEGVMGYYDGGENSEISTFEVAKRTGTNAVILVDAKGSAVSALAAAYGIADFGEESLVCGVIFNRMSKAVYEQVQRAHEKRKGNRTLRLLGYIPILPEECKIESRHLGLVTAEEIHNLKEKVALAHAKMEQTIDWSGIIEIAEMSGKLMQKDKYAGDNDIEIESGNKKEVVEISATSDDIGICEGEDAHLENVTQMRLKKENREKDVLVDDLVIAVAKDSAFCFYYEDNLDLLREQGCKISYFSPLKNETVPGNACGLYLGGGYPELYLDELEKNEEAKQSIREAIGGGMPCIAECGGFMYLSEKIEGRKMCGVIPGDVTNAGKLVRFGYVTLTAKEDSLLFEKGDQIRTHEFHYYDSTENGSCLIAEKRNGVRYPCGVTTDTLYAGYPHLYFGSNPKVPERFAKKCREYGAMNGKEMNRK